MTEWLSDSPCARVQQTASEDDATTNHVENGSSTSGGNTSVLQIVDLMNKLEQREEHISQMELELAQTKVHLTTYNHQHHINVDSC